jgi:hypothetical protein
LVHYEVQHLEQKMMRLVRHITPSKAGIAGIFIILTGQLFTTRPWEKNQVFIHDAQEYYAFLPAAFIHHDLNFTYFGKPGHERAVWVPLIPTKNGQTVKRSVGQAVMLMPFYLIAHVWMSTQSEPFNGYEEPFQIAACLGALLYVFLAMVLLRKVIRPHAGEWATLLTLAILFLGTNLYYYSAILGTMTHATGFFLFALFLWLTVRWHHKPHWRTSLALGLTLGLVTIVRPTNMIIVLCFVLYNWPGVKARALLLLPHKWLVVLMTAATVVPVLMQLMLWKYQNDTWVFYSYGDERFFWADPEIINGLFSFRNGLFSYAPLLLLAIPGMVWLFVKKNPWKWAVVVFFPLNVYIIYSWWCWWYGGAYGSRAAIESYVVLAIPLSLFLHRFFTGLVLRPVLVLLVFGGIMLNQSNVKWFLHGVLHYDAMTASSYLNLVATGHQPAFHFDRMREPDYEGAMQGSERYDDWQQMTPGNPYSNTVMLEGPFGDSLKLEVSFGLFSSLKFPEQTVALVVSGDSNGAGEAYYFSYPLGPEYIGGQGWNMPVVPLLLVIPEGIPELKVYLLYSGKSEAYYRPLAARRIPTVDSSSEPLPAE